MDFKKTVLIIFLVITSHVVSAQSLYVTDKVLLGIYKDQQQNELIKVFPSGTPLEILSREGNDARVRAPDGTEGWVDASYLINEKPAQLQLLALTDDLKTAKAEIEELKKKLESAGKTETPAATSEADAKQIAELKTQVESTSKQVEQLEKDNADLKKQLAAKQDNSSDNSEALQESQAALEKANNLISQLEEQLKQTQAQTSETDPRLAQLETAQAEMQEKIDKAVIALTGSQNTSSSVSAVSTDNILWYALGLGLVLIFGFALGAVWLDRRNLRRHGGFRI